MSAVLHLITGDDFLFGALAGVIGAAAIVLLRRWDTDWGVVWGLAVVAGLFLTGRSGWLAFRLASNGNPWVLPAAVLAAGLGYLGVRGARETPVSGLAVAITMAGIWATVPETDRISVLIGVTAVMVWIWWPLQLSRPSIAGSIVIGVFAAWAVIIGGIPRPTAVVGGLGSIVALWVTARFVPQENQWLWVGIHLALVLAWSRWAGLSTTIPTALFIGGAASLAAVAVGRLIPRPG